MILGIQSVALCTGIEHTLVSSSDELASVVAAHGNQQVLCTPG